MGDNNNVVSLADIMNDLKVTSEALNKSETATGTSLRELKSSASNLEAMLGGLKDEHKSLVTKLDGVETSVNDLWKRQGRPGHEMSKEDIAERKAAIELLQLKHEQKITTKDPEHPFAPSENEIKEATVYIKALSALMNTLDPTTLPVEYRKSLSAFSFGSNAFILAPEMSNRVISCITDPTDVAGLMDSMTTARPSVRFMVDNSRTAVGAWACEAACFANNPQPDLQEGIGEMEIKPETLRFIICATRDLLEDASINIEAWMMNKVNNGLRTTINNAILTGDGLGKPLGIMNPAAGIPICDVSPATPTGQFTWQDLVMLKYEIPMQWQAGASYLMNQRTFALLMTMSDTANRPLWGQLPGGEPGFMLAGSPIHIVTQMPDVGPGAYPVAYGNWKNVYMIVWRKAITMQQDPYSAGYCILYKFEARVGGGVLCPNAARLLRLR